MIVAVLQARMSSSRLPGKVLRPVLGRALLSLQLERIGRSRRIDRLVVATSDRPEDDPIEGLARHDGVACFRGDLDDVLDRVYRAAAPSRPDYVVRLTGDCPLTDPEVVDRVIEFCTQGGYDFVSNALAPTYPDGLDVEIARFSCLEEAWREARLPSEREHVMPFIHRRPERFRIGVLKHPVNLSRLRWTVDEAEDLDLVQRIFEALYPQDPAFAMGDVLALIERDPALATLNAHHARNAGRASSERKDAAFLTRGEGL